MPGHSRALTLLPGSFSIGKLSRAAPGFPPSSLFSCSVTESEARTLICPTNEVPPLMSRRSNGWRALRIQGPLDLATSGVLVSVLAPLASAEVPVLVASSFETDTVFVPGGLLPSALAVLGLAGHTVVHEGPT